MNLGEAFQSSLSNLATHRLRSALTMLGVVFGVGAVISMLSIGAGAETRAQAMIEKLGSRNVLIRSAEIADDKLREVRQKSLGVSLRDVDAIPEAVPGVTAVAPVAELKASSILSGTTTTEASVYGVTPLHRPLRRMALKAGRFIDPLDLERHSQVCVIGEDVRRELFGFRTGIGELLKVDDVWLRVVGLLEADSSGEESFEGVALGSSSNVIYLPLSTALRKFDQDPLASPLSEIVVQLERGASGRSTARAIDGLLSRLHAGEADYELVVPEALLAQSRKTQRLFNIVMGCIAGISLLVGGIGIMNIMLASVLERTREIGIRRAVGARRRDVLIQFIVESFSISAFGGLAGILMGVVIAKVVAASAGWPTVVTPASILVATGVAVSVGLASGIYPARRAAELDPIEALRYE